MAWAAEPEGLVGDLVGKYKASQLLGIVAMKCLLHLEDEMPGQNALINDIIKNALHPVVSSELRAVIKQHGKPRNQIQWHEFESLRIT